MTPSPPRLLEYGLRAGPWVPRPLLRVAARIAADVHYHVDGRRRRAVVANVARLAPAADADRQRSLVRNTFRQFAASTADVLALAGRPPHRWLPSCELDTRALRAAHAEGRGVIAVAPHLGPWDLGVACLGSLGCSVAVLVERLPGDGFDAYARIRRRLGVEIIPADRPHAMRHVLRTGGVLLVVADRAVVGRGLPMPFAGGWRIMPVGPATLALRHRTPVVLAWVVRGATRRLEFGTRRVPQPDGADVASLTMAITDGLSRLVTRHPDQWFVFQDEWLGPPGSPSGGLG